LRELREAVSELESQLEDEDRAKRREAAKEAASKSRQLADNAQAAFGGRRLGLEGAPGVP
jgi:hypothetical protein